MCLNLVTNRPDDHLIHCFKEVSHAKLGNFFWKANCQSWPKNCWTLWNWQNDVVVVASKFLIVDSDMMRMKLLTLCNWLQFICLALIIIYYTCIILCYYIYYLLYLYIPNSKSKNPWKFWSYICWFEQNFMSAPAEFTASR